MNKNLAAWFAGGAVLGVAVLVVLWQRARDECRATACFSHLYGIGNALRAYHAMHGAYPPSPEEQSATAPAVSWRVLILLSTGPDLAGYDPGQPWNSPHNEQFIPALVGDLFSCPSDSDPSAAGRTVYLAVVGDGTVWSEVRSGRIRSPEKEVPRKIVVIEVPHSGVDWTEPRDISAEDAVVLFRRENGFKDGRHRKGLHYLAADGSVHNFDEIDTVEAFASRLRATGSPRVK
jgi:hypothetical protein